MAMQVTLATLLNSRLHPHPSMLHHTKTPPELATTPLAA
jgi:hypothetical protein